MIFGLLWIEFLLGTLFLCAAKVAVQRGRGKLLRVVLDLLLGLSNGYLTFAVMWTWFLRFRLRMDPNWFAYVLSLFVSSAIGQLSIWAIGRRGDADGTSRSSHWSPRRIIVGVLTMAALGALTVWNIDRLERVEAIKVRSEAGAMMRAEAPPSYPEELNAAPLYRRAFAEAQTSVEMNPTDWPRADECPAPAGQTAAKIIDRNADALNLLRRAAALPGSHFDFDDAHPEVVPFLNAVKGARFAADFLRLDARRQAVLGHVPEAVADINAISAVSRAVGSEPFIMPTLIASGIDNLAVLTTEDVLPYVKRPGDVNAIRLDGPDMPQRRLSRMLRGQEGLGLANLVDGELTDLAGQPTAPDSFLNPRHYLLYRLFFSQSVLGRYRGFVDAAREIPQQPFVQGRERAAQLEAQYPSPAPLGLFPYTEWFPTPRLIASTSEAQAYHLAVSIAVAATHYRLDHRGLPDALDQLVPDYLSTIPLDPFDGNSMRWKLHGGDRLIYSVGPDLKDDGGRKKEDRQRNSDGWDIVFTLKSPPKILDERN